MRTISILTILLASTLAWSKGKDCKNYDQYTDVTKAEMQKIVKSNKATIIDANSANSYKENRIPGSKSYANNREDLAKILPKDKSQMIVAYCGGKMCTAWQRPAKIACEMGYTNIRHFSEGIKGWNKMNPAKKKAPSKKG